MIAIQTKRMTEAEFREFSLCVTTSQWQVHRGELAEESEMVCRGGFGCQQSSPEVSIDFEEPFEP